MGQSQVGWKSMGAMTGGTRRVWWRNIWAGGALVLLVVVVLLSGCGLFDGGTTAASTDKQVTLKNVPWCDRPSLTFQDDSTTDQKLVSDWSAVKDQLGFTPYLPPAFPKGTCLAVAGGSVHNPIYGGQLSVTYVLPTVGPVSFSEAPKRPNIPEKPQCVESSVQSGSSATPTATPGAPATNVCIGAISGTSVTIASRQSQSEIQAIYKTLRSATDWVPAAENRVTPTSTGK